jgi:drug/metabolite transporter (DMT)-like permease
MSGVALALVSAILFGASTPASKLLLGSLGPFQLAGLLYLGAALGMAFPLERERRRVAPSRLDARNLRRLAGAVVFGGVIGPVLLLFGLELSSAGSVSLWLNLEMAATAVLGVVLFREHLGGLGWAGVVGVVVSGMIVSAGGGWPGWAAAGLVAAACVCWGLDNHLTALIDGITPARSTFWKGLVAGATNLGIGVVVEPLSWGGAALLGALVVGALSYGASIALYIASAQQIGATRAQAVFASAPFLGAGLAFGLLGEPISAGHVIGGHEHQHVHEPVEHVHAHRHDDGHHQHEHPGLPPGTRHVHRHRHERLVHAHPHWPDLHHRHDHDSATD